MPGEQTLAFEMRLFAAEMRRQYGDRYEGWASTIEEWAGRAEAAGPQPDAPERPEAIESGERLARIIQEADEDNPEWARGARFVLGWTKGPDDPALEAAFRAVRDPAAAPTASPDSLDADLLRHAKRNVERRNNREFVFDRDLDGLLAEYERLRAKAGSAAG